MAETYRDQSPREVALLVHDYHDTANERAKAGDIIAVRKIGTGNGHGEVGRAERSAFLWLRLQSVSQFDDLDLTQLLEENGVRYDKRRFCVPFARLKLVAPWLGLARVEDKTDPYQPFMGGIDRDQDYTVHTLESAKNALIAEGKTPVEVNAIIEPIEEEVLAKRLGRRNRLDQQKLGNREVMRRDDGTFALQLAGESTAGHYLAPRQPLSVEGLVFDKQFMRYL